MICPFKASAIFTISFNFFQMTVYFEKSSPGYLSVDCIKFTKIRFLPFVE